MNTKLASRILLLLLLFGLDCYQVRAQNIQSELFKVSRDTIRINIEGRLSQALLVNDKYYCFYEVRDPMSTQPIKKFYIIEKNGKKVKEIKVPKDILKDTYPSLRYWKGEIIANTEFYPGSYYLELTKGEFMKSAEIITVPIFEDENYKVTAKCNGEFGSTIYFEDKTTKITYSNYSGCPFLVNKLEDKYFVNASSVPNDYILEIKVPVKVELKDKDVSANKSPLLPSKSIFERSSFDFNFFIPTSFVANGALYHIYNSSHNEFKLDEKKERIVITKDTVKIGIISNGKFKPVYTFKERFDIGFQQQLSPNYQICTFHTEQRMQIGFKKDNPPYKEAKYGVIEIKNNEIRIHYFFSKKGV
jgi:hypothetical protein